MIPVAVLTGGIGTRMRPWTEKIPKSLLEVAGEPFLAHQLRSLASQGIEKVILCVGHMASQIEKFAGDGSDFGLQVRYSREGTRLFGTGGALRKALPLLGEEFFVLYGDSWLEIDYSNVFKAFKDSRLPALMTVFHNQGRWDTSNVEIFQGQIKLYSKKNRNKNMTHIDYGLGILTKHVLDLYPVQQAFDLAEIYEQLSLHQKLACFEATKRFYEIGSPSGLEELNQKFGDKL
jgi:NDP-sugar pyrophosphorylase family protein